MSVIHARGQSDAHRCRNGGGGGAAGASIAFGPSNNLSKLTYNCL